MFFNTIKIAIKFVFFYNMIITIYDRMYIFKLTQSIYQIYLSIKNYLININYEFYNTTLYLKINGRMVIIYDQAILMY